MMDGFKGRDASRENTVTVHVYCTICTALLPQVPFPHRPPILIFNIHKSIPIPRPASQRPCNVQTRNLALTLLLLPAQAAALSDLRCSTSSSIASQPSNSALLMNPSGEMVGATSGAASRRGS